MENINETERLLKLDFNNRVAPLITRMEKYQIYRYTGDKLYLDCLNTILDEIIIKEPNKKEKIEEIKREIYGILPYQGAVREELEMFDNIINKSTMPMDVITYRTTSKELFYATSKIENDTFTPYIWLSTSLDLDLSSKFTSFLSPNNRIVIEFRIPKGFIGFYTGTISTYKREKEVILQRNIPYQIIEKEEKGIEKIIAIPKNR